jgi:hypothetical protein
MVTVDTLNETGNYKFRFYSHVSLKRTTSLFGKQQTFENDENR